MSFSRGHVDKEPNEKNLNLIYCVNFFILLQSLFFCSFASFLLWAFGFTLLSLFSEHLRTVKMSFMWLMLSVLFSLSLIFLLVPTMCTSHHPSRPPIHNLISLNGKAFVIWTIFLLYNNVGKNNYNCWIVASIAPSWRVVSASISW